MDEKAVIVRGKAMKFVHKLNLLDASDGYISEGLMIELEKLETKDVEIEIAVVSEVVGHGEPPEWEAVKDAYTLAWEIIVPLAAIFNGSALPFVLTLEIVTKMHHAIKDNIQQFIDKKLPDLVGEYKRDEHT